jgi:hypothetical protein
VELLGWSWSVVQQSSPVVTVLLMVVLYGMDKLWNERQTALGARVTEISGGLERMGTRVDENKNRVGALDKDVSTVVATTSQIAATLDKHDKDERSFWSDMRRFMLHQGFNGDDNGSS